VILNIHNLIKLGVQSAFLFLTFHLLRVELSLVAADLGGAREQHGVDASEAIRFILSLLYRTRQTKQHSLRTYKRERSSFFL
jgi:hypothetical protein